MGWFLQLFSYYSTNTFIVFPSSDSILTNPPTINGSDTLNSIDFKEIINLVEQGVVGELVSIDSADGDTIKIFVE